MSQNASLTFLPHLRLGANAKTDIQSAGGRRTVGFDIDVYKESSVAKIHTQNVTLKGPGDILGFSSDIVARTEPLNYETNFEPNYFAYLEFKEADFPWRYSIEQDVSGRVYPWIALIVLKREDEFQLDGISSANLPMIRIKKPVLPDLKQLWAWAHVQLSGGMFDEQGNPLLPTDLANYADGVKEYLQNKPALTLSRLICPRKLDKSTLYSAFVVPAYKAGAQAGRGEIPENSADQAWSEGETDILLPVYYTWDFKTTENGDFEELLDQLEFGGDLDEVGFRPIDGRNPGFITDQNGNPLELINGQFYGEGALSSDSTVGADDNFINIEFTTGIISTLRDALNDKLVLNGKTGTDPLVSIPVYGQYYSDKPQLFEPDTAGEWSSGQWLSEMNMDPAYRLAASLGTEVVQENQEQFVKECWEQAGDIKEANELLRLASAAKQAEENIDVRHVRPLEDYKYTLITQPFQGLYAVTNKTGEKSYQQAFKESGLPAGQVTYPFRKVITTRLGNDQSIKDGFFKPWGKIPNDVIGPRINDNDTTVYRKMAELLDLGGIEDSKQYFAIFNKWLPAVPPLKPEVITVDPLDIGDNKENPPDNSLRGKVNVEKAIINSLNAVIKIDGTTITRPVPILKYPRISTPMSKFLIGKSLDVLVPYISKLKKNTVALFEQNSRFIEAYMAGLNHELNRELIWRGFPTDGKGTIFNIFWNVFNFRNPVVDIKDIKEWTGILGTNGGRPSTQGNAVIAAKADLFKRYQNTIIYALKVNKNHSMVGYDPTEYEVLPPWEYIFDNINQGNQTVDNLYWEIEPLSFVHVNEDILFIFFPFCVDDIKNDATNQYYFIIMQPPTLPRFGLDVSRDVLLEPLSATWDNLSWVDVGINDNSGWIDLDKIQGDLLDKNSMVGLNNTAQVYYEPMWGQDSAGTAWITYQKPVRIVVHAEELIG